MRPMGLLTYLAAMKNQNCGRYHLHEIAICWKSLKACHWLEAKRDLQKIFYILLNSACVLVVSVELCFPCKFKTYPPEFYSYSLSFF